MGLNFYKELFLASEQIYPPPEKRSYELSRTQVSSHTVRAHNEVVILFTVSPLCDFSKT